MYVDVDEIFEKNKMFSFFVVFSSIFGRTDMRISVSRAKKYAESDFAIENFQKQQNCKKMKKKSSLFIRTLRRTDRRKPEGLPPHSDPYGGYRWTDEQTDLAKTFTYRTYACTYVRTYVRTYERTSERTNE